MKKIIFLFFVLFSTLAPSEAGAIISHRAEINAPSVKKATDTKDFTKKDWGKFGLIMGVIGLVFGVLGLVLATPTLQLLFLLSALGCFIVAIIGLLKSL